MNADGDNQPNVFEIAKREMLQRHVFMNRAKALPKNILDSDVEQDALNPAHPKFQEIQRVLSTQEPTHEEMKLFVDAAKLIYPTMANTA